MIFGLDAQKAHILLLDLVAEYVLITFTLVFSELEMCFYCAAISIQTTGWFRSTKYHNKPCWDLRAMDSGQLWSGLLVQNPESRPEMQHLAV